MFAQLYNFNDKSNNTFQGRLLSGIPELDYHFAGITLSGKVILQCVDESRFKLMVSCHQNSLIEQWS
jgi:hypothetical protein